jgi:hypothetical protein
MNPNIVETLEQMITKYLPSREKVLDNINSYGDKLVEDKQIRKFSVSITDMGEAYSDPTAFRIFTTMFFPETDDPEQVVARVNKFFVADGKITNEKEYLKARKATA